MKKIVLAMGLCASLLLVGRPSLAGLEDCAWDQSCVEDDRVEDARQARHSSYYDEYDDSQSHPFRVAAYLVHPVGVALEWVIFRPFHYFISMPYVAEATGHHPHGKTVIY